MSRVLTRDPEPFVRYEALVGLDEIGGDRVKGLLRVALADLDELVWAKAAELLHIRQSPSRKR